MTLLTSFYSYLAAQSTLTDQLYSANAIFPGRLPQNHDGFPAITYTLQDDEEISLQPSGISALHFADIEVYCYAEDAPTVDAVADALKQVLVGIYGAPVAPVAFGANFADRIEKTGELYDFETVTELHFVRLTFRFSYR